MMPSSEYYTPRPKFPSHDGEGLTSVIPSVAQDLPQGRQEYSLDGVLRHQGTLLRFITRYGIWLVWLVFICAVSAASLDALHKYEVPLFQNGFDLRQDVLDDMPSVSTIYRDASLKWLKGEDLYNHTGKGFIYLPQAALVYMPFAKLPLISEVLWRIFSVLVFIFSLWRMAGVVAPYLQKSFFIIASLVAIPIAHAAGLNGQMNLLATAVMLLAIVAVNEQAWWRASFYLVFSLALKPITLPLILLVGILYPRMLWRIGLGFIVLFLLPFLAQEPAYVVSQYQGAIQMLSEAAAVGSQAALYEWAQFFGLLSHLKIEFSAIVQDGIRLVAAAITLLLCAKAKKTFPKNKALLFIFAFAMSYLMLFNPRTENNTYVMLAPALGFFLAGAFLIEKKRLKALFYMIPALGLALAHEITRQFTPEHRWLQPLVTLIFCATVIYDLYRNQKELKLASTGFIHNPEL
jgi:hypothetical protein